MVRRTKDTHKGERCDADLSPYGECDLGAVAVVFTLGLSTSIAKSIWTDDAASLYSARLSWGQLWRQSRIVDRVYLPYYALLHVWLLVSTSVEWARVPSLVAYAVTIFLVGRLGYRFRGFWCGLLAVALCASNPLLVQEALSIRPYALTALSATLSVTCLLGWLKDEKNWQMWCFAIAAVATAVLQLFARLVPLVALAAVLALRHRVVKEHGGASSRRWGWRRCESRLRALHAGPARADQLDPSLHALKFRRRPLWPSGRQRPPGRIAYTLVIGCLLDRRSGHTFSLAKSSQSR